MTKIKIVYASMTGNDEDIADILSEDFEEAGMQVDLSEISQTDVADYLQADVCIMVSYTYSDGLEGNIPDEVFYRQVLIRHLSVIPMSLLILLIPQYRRIYYNHH